MQTPIKRELQVPMIIGAKRKIKQNRLYKRRIEVKPFTIPPFEYNLSDDHLVGIFFFHNNKK